jgi:hypothetical protein
MHGRIWKRPAQQLIETELREHTQHRPRLASLRRRGMLKPGVYSLAWSCRGEPAGSISIIAQADGVRLLYRVTGPKGERISVNEFVPFRYTPTRFGGHRQWLACLRCGRHCRRIFGGRHFRCRQCHGLEYASRNESPAQRDASRRQDREPAARHVEGHQQGQVGVPTEAVSDALADLYAGAVDSGSDGTLWRLTPLSGRPHCTALEAHGTRHPHRR